MKKLPRVFPRKPSVGRSLPSETAIFAAENPAQLDNRSVDNFAQAMRLKLAIKRLDGRGGWQDKDQCSNEYLSQLLRDHVEKGDPIDVANFAMMIHQRGERIASVYPESARRALRTALDHIEHMAAFIGTQNAGYSFESLGEDMQGMRDALENPSPETGVVSIVPPHCTGYSFSFDPGTLHVRKDGSGYIVINEDDLVLEDDRCEGPDGPEGSVHWIARMDASEMVALRNFLNGANPSPETRAEERP